MLCVAGRALTKALTPRWVRALIRGALWLLGLLVVRPVTFLLYARPGRGGRKRLPALTNPILSMRAQDIARAVRTRKVTARRHGPLTSHTTRRAFEELVEGRGESLGYYREINSIATFVTPVRLFTFQLRAEEVTSAFIERIKVVNPIVNAVVDRRFAEAIQEARDMDAKLDAGEAAAHALLQLPLLGVPITVKESIAVKGAAPYNS